MYYVYCLLSLKDDKTYIGSTNNLERRLQEHNLGQAKSTKHRRPLKLLFKEEFFTKLESKQRELWWKSSSGRRKLRELFKC